MYRLLTSQIYTYVYIYIYLVGGFNPSEKYYGLLRLIVEAQGSRTTLSPCARSMSEKYASQLGLLFPTEWKIKFMFQTTNQI